METSEKQKESHGALITVAGVVFILATAALIYYFSNIKVSYNRKKMKTHIERIEEEYARASSIPPEKNAWHTYNKALKHYVPIRKITNRINRTHLENALDSGPNRAEVEIIKEHKDRNEKWLKEAKNAYNTDAFIIPAGFKSGLQSDRSKARARIIIYNEIVRMLCLWGDMEAQEKRYKKAVQYYLIALHISRGVGNYGDDRQAYFSLRADGLIFYRLKRVLWNADCDSDYYKSVMAEMNRVNQVHYGFHPWLEVSFMTRNAHYEKYISRDKIMPYYNQKKNFNSLEKSALLQRQRRARKILKAVYLEMKKLLDGKKYVDPDQFKAGIGRIDHTDVSKSWSMNLWQLQLFYLLDRVEFEGIKTLCALKAYKADKGAYPESLDKLVPDYINVLPEDPFQKEGTLMYKKKNSKIMLYSVGPDGKDDNCSPALRTKEIFRNRQGIGHGDIVIVNTVTNN